MIVFVGPSGCGKSTLLRMIAGLEKITGGDFSIDGVRMNHVPPGQRGIAMVFQSYALYPHMTVRDNMSFALKLARKSQAEIDAAVEKAARTLQLTPYLDRPPKALSGGQRQRVAIGRTIVRDPKVYLFDEPLSNLDAALRVRTRIEIAQLKETMPSRRLVPAPMPPPLGMSVSLRPYRTVGRLPTLLSVSAIPGRPGRMGNLPTVPPSALATRSMVRTSARPRPRPARPRSGGCPQGACPFPGRIRGWG